MELSSLVHGEMVKIPAGWYEQEGYPATGKVTPHPKSCSTVIKTCIELCRFSQTAAEVRERFADYFCSSAGEVSWQYTMSGVLRFNHYFIRLCPFFRLYLSLTAIVIRHSLTT